MPELPEVESVRVALEAPLRGRRIEGVRLPDERCAAHPAAEAFCDGLRGRAFSALGRRGKFLYAALDDGGKLVVHLRMTGRLLLAEASAAHVRAAFWLDDGRELRFVDARRFGRLWLLRPGEEDTYTGMAGLGPEPDDPALNAAYLRGAFLGSGFIADPRGDFHFEITVASEEMANGMVALLAERDITARILQRRSSFIVYLKSGTAISDFLAFVGAHQSALRMENERVRKSVRNNVNRKVNAEVANQAKSSEAAVEQIVSIRKLAESGKVADLAPGLQEFVRLRLQYPNASLKELGERANPPLSKSAVYHRVRRLEQLAKDL